MEIKNLSQFKKAMASGHAFEIVEHYIKPQYTGQVRRVQKLQTNGMYTGILDHPEAELSQQNYGKGSWIDFGKAGDWTFEDSVCTQSAHGKPVWKIRVI